MGRTAQLVLQKVGGPGWALRSDMGHSLIWMSGCQKLCLAKRQILKPALSSCQLIIKYWGREQNTTLFKSRPTHLPCFLQFKRRVCSIYISSFRNIFWQNVYLIIMRTLLGGGGSPEMLSLWQIHMTAIHSDFQPKMVLWQAKQSKYLPPRAWPPKNSSSIC